MDDNAEPTTESGEMPGTGERRWRNRMIAGGVAAGLTFAGLGIANAQIDDDDTPVAGPDAIVERVLPEIAGHGPGMFGKPGPGFHAFGMGMGIHGEFTRPAAGGGYQTIATQTGKVTAVKADSLTVKSADDFSRTYAINDDTLVNAGNEGIGDVKEGDEVHVTAIVKDGKATAVDVNDGTRIKASREKWAPMPKLRNPAAKESTASS